MLEVGESKFVCSLQGDHLFRILYFNGARAPPSCPAEEGDDAEPLVLVESAAAAVAVESFPCAFCSRTYSHVKAKNKHMLSEHAAECEERGMHFKCVQCPQARK